VQQWAQHDSAGVDFRLFDLSREDPTVLGEFDFIYSNGTLEHVVHPFALLSTLMKLLPVGGRMHFNMGLHRGTMGSHLYRDVDCCLTSQDLLDGPLAQVGARQQRVSGRSHCGTLAK